ncbi:MAG: DUF1800 domain-containing protein [Fibrobacterota bacterium]|nr:MAG: DUF1800 domain-containing protein [Fibrobacterota bacterium]
MDRRQFMATLFGAGTPAGTRPAPKLARDAAFVASANAILPRRQAVGAGLEPFQGAWTKAEASHLLRRTLFGHGKAELDRAVALGMAGTVDALLDVPSAQPDPPVVTSATETTLPVGSTWVDQPYIGERAYERSRNLQAWWMGLLLHQNLSIREKMTLFWQNHFATEWRVADEPHHLYRHLARLRANCLGDFKKMVREVTLDPAMLRYLNGNTNTKSSPNENYGRELQELFTIGKGPEIAPGDYTHYTEDDVKAAARVLTGWRDLRDKPDAEFRPTQHDASDKVFSRAYGNVVVKGRPGAEGALEVDDLITMILTQPQTALHVCRKLYRFFVYYVIDPDVEQNVIAPLAQLLVASNWNIKPVVERLLKSAHFYHAANRGCSIKSPLDLVVGSLRQFGSTLPGTTDLALRYQVWLTLQDQSASMQQEILSPPNVAGWPAYYQEPVYYQAWISSDTLPRRVQFTDRCMGAKGYQIGTWYMVADVISMASAVSDPADLAVLVSEMTEFVFAVPVTEKQKAYLRGIVLGGAPEYEWNKNWTAYTAAPADPTKRSVVESRLRNLLKAMAAMAEFQLC